MRGACSGSTSLLISFMQASFRFGDQVSAGRYPLPVSAAPIWQVSDGRAEARLPVPPCPSQHILVPSVSLPEQQADFQCTLEIGGARWRLRAVPGQPASDTRAPHPGVAAFSASAQGAGPEVSTHIDCFHSERDIPASRLVVRLGQPETPRRFLVTLSVRPLQMEPALPHCVRLVLDRPPAISQMRGPAPIRKRICSPTALAMALRAANPGIAWNAVVEACFDGRFYGSWPLAIHCAARHGRLGAVEAIDSWTPVLRTLEAGSPVVASIRFGRGELPGAPLPETAGHLVTVYGIDGSRVLVCDPAAPDDASVPRDYELGAFTAAWMRHRGAAYLLAPP